MADLYLAQRLRMHADALHQMSSAGLGYSANSRLLTSCGMIATAAHYTLLGFVASSLAIEDDLDGPPASLTAIARGLAEATVRTFKPFEYDTLAMLDTVHRAPVTRVLLPDGLAQRIYSDGERFVGNLLIELRERLDNSKGEKT